MKKLHELLFRLGALFRREKLDAEMREEMQHHLDLAAKEHIDDGISHGEARYAARRRFGGVEQIKESARDQRSFVWLEQFGQDLRYGVRALRKNPGFTFVAAFTLALGIGANTTVFSFLNAMALRPPAVPGGEELVRVHGFDPNRNRFTALTYPDFVEYRTQSTTCAGLVAFGNAGEVLLDATSTTATNPEHSDRLNVELVSDNYFEVLRVPFAAGGGFHRETQEPVAVLGHRFWQERFGGDSAIIGKSIVLNGRAWTVVGVIGSDFRSPRFGPLPEVWIPMALQPQLARNGENRLQSRDNAWVSVFGRLQSSASRSQAQEEMTVIGRRLDREFPRPMARHVRVLRPSLFEPNDLRGNATRTGILFIAGPALLLLIACANVGNLLLARGATRAREMAIRLSLGATRVRLFRQLLTETALLGLLGGAGGFLLSMWLTQALANFLMSEPKASLLMLTPDGRVYAFAFALSVIAPLVFGVMPALRASGLKLADAMKSGGGQARGTSSRLQNGFVIGQVALSSVLLIVAGLLVRTLHKALTVDPGIDLRQLAAIVPETRVPGFDQARAAELHRALIERLRSQPAISGVASSHYIPGMGNRSAANAWLPDGRTEVIRFNRVSPEYFATVGQPLAMGRFFTADEAARGAALSIVTESAARKLWPEQNPLGKQFRIGKDGPLQEVIGVVPNVPNRVLLEDEPEFYQLLVPADLPGAALLVRTEGDPAALLPLLASEVRAIEQQLRARVFAVAANAQGQVHGEKTIALLASSISGLAMLLAAVGLYGVVAFFVGQRTTEIGVRLALGASNRDVIRLVVGRGVRLVLWGSLIGATLAALCAQALKGMLFGIAPIDPATFVGVTLLLVAIALFAGWLPARRAARVDPVVALRAE
jgi:predicted permease